MSWVPVHIEVNDGREVIRAVEIVGPFADQGPHVMWALVEHRWADGAKSLLVEDARQWFDTGNSR